MVDRGRVGLIAFVALAVVTLALAACGGEDVGTAEAEAAAGEADTVVHSVMGESAAGEYTFTLDKASVPAGVIEFEISNEGELEHEFEVIKTDVAADEIPVVSGKANVEAGGGIEVDEVEDIESGASTELKVELESGKYLIVCNLPGHYEQGMVTTFTVE